MLHAYRITFDEVYWYFAPNAKRALELFRTEHSISRLGQNEVTISEENPDNRCAFSESRKMVLGSSQKEIEQFRRDWGPEDLKKATIKPWREWAQEKGEGFFASTA